MKYGVAQGDQEIEHWPKDRIWSHILTKPLQGRSFKYFILLLMNGSVDYEDEIKHEDAGNNAGVSNTNTYVLTDKTND